VTCVNNTQGVSQVWLRV